MEANFKCGLCGMIYYNMVEDVYRCTECGSKDIIVLKPLVTKQSIKTKKPSFKKIRRR